MELSHIYFIGYVIAFLILQIYESKNGFANFIYAIFYPILIGFMFFMAIAYIITTLFPNKNK